jgi:hypothetical protein
MEGAISVEILDIDLVLIHVVQIESLGVCGRDEYHCVDYYI